MLDEKIAGVPFQSYFFFLLSFQRRNKNLALPSAEQQALENVKAGLETWEYTARNTLMYYPTGEACKSLRRVFCLGGLTPDSAYPPSDRTALTGAAALFLL